MRWQYSRKIGWRLPLALASSPRMPYDPERRELRFLPRSEIAARAGAKVPRRARLVEPRPPHPRGRRALRFRTLARHGRDGLDGHRRPRAVRRRGLRLPRAVRHRRGAGPEPGPDAVFLDDLPGGRGAAARGKRNTE